MATSQTVPEFASRIAARLDRLPVTRTLWRLVFLISLGGAFELYDIFLSTYIAPGLVAGGMFTSSAANLFSINGIGFLWARPPIRNRGPAGTADRCGSGAKA